MGFNFNNETPIYIQIIEEIKQRIIRGMYVVNQKIPSVRDLAFEFEVNPNTVVKALVELENLGLIFTDSTNGKFVTTNEELIKGVKNKEVIVRINEFLQSMQQIGLNKQEIIELLNGRD